MPTLTGTLNKSRPGQFTGHLVEVTYNTRLSLPAINQDGAAHLSVPRTISATVTADGAYSIQIPDEQISGPVHLRARAPNGSLLHERVLEGIATLPLDLGVEPAEPLLLGSAGSPERGQRLRLTGRIVDPSGRRPPVGTQVVGWGEQEAGTAAPLFAARTDAEGHFSAAWPSGRYSGAYATIAATGTIRHRITLDSNGMYPRSILIATTLSAPSADRDDEPCDCHGLGVTTPRAPDADDLVNSPSVYSTDLGTGRCTDLTTPNRTLEEYNFYTVVRTTDPRIRGLTIADPVRVSGPLLSELVTQAASLAAGGGVTVIVPEGTAPIAVPVGDGTTTQSSEGDLSDAAAPRFKPSAEKTWTDAMVTRRAVDPKTAEQLVTGAAALQIDVDQLSRLSNISEGFTPTQLVAAERRTLARRAQDVMSVLARPVPDRADLNSNNPLDWDQTPTFFQATTIAHGHILCVKQSWRADGYSLGDLLYSLPLAPGQKKLLAVTDWERREEARRHEHTLAGDRLDASLERVRDINEIVRASLSETAQGGSDAITWGVGGGVAGSGAGVVGSVAGGAGGGHSRAWQEGARGLTASTLQQIRDRTVQAAASVREQRSTVVQTVGQTESVRVQTESVANNNHCHAVTMQYFEVLRHFQVTQELTDVQECLFVPLPMSAFDARKALRWRDPLSRWLRKPELGPAFDALDRMENAYDGSNLPQSRFADDAIETCSGELRISFHLPRPRDNEDGSFNEAGWTLLRVFFDPLGIFTAHMRGQEQRARDVAWNTEIAPNIAKQLIQDLRFFVRDVAGHLVAVGFDPTLISSYVPATPLEVALASVGGFPRIARSRVGSVEIRTDRPLPPGARVVVHSGSLRYRTANFEHTLFQHARIENDLAVDDPVVVDTPCDTFELRNPRWEDRQASRRLLAHLNEHLEYYHRAIWWNMDAERRYMLLDGFVAPNTAMRSIASVVENRLIGIVGNSWVLPVAPGFKLDPTYNDPRAQSDDPTIEAAVRERILFEHYAPLTPGAPMRVSVPTRGVFAEAMMGSCNACEKKDDSRFWRWDEAPIPGEPPSIAGVSAETRRAEPADLRPQPLSSPIVAMQAAPAAPDPAGLGAALQLLGQASLFRDITGLEGNQRNALGALQSSLETARSMASQAVQVRAQEQSARSMSSSLQAIRDAQRSGTLPPERASALTEDVIRAASGTSRSAPSRLSTSPGIEQLARTAVNSGGEVSINDDAGSVRLISARQTSNPAQSIAPPTSTTNASDTAEDSAADQAIRDLGAQLGGAASGSTHGSSSEPSATSGITGVTGSSSGTGGTTGQNGSVPLDVPANLDPALEARLDTMARVRQEGLYWFVDFPTDYVRPFGLSQVYLGAVVRLVRHLFGTVATDAVVAAMRAIIAEGAGLTAPNTTNLERFAESTVAIPIDVPFVERLQRHLNVPYRTGITSSMENIEETRFFAEFLAWASERSTELSRSMDAAALRRSGITASYVFGLIATTRSRMILAPVVMQLASTTRARSLFRDTREATRSADGGFNRAVFFAVTDDVWAQILTQLGTILRRREERIAAQAVEEHSRLGYSSVHAPQEVGAGLVADLVQFAVPRFNPNGRCRVELGSPVDIYGGSHLRNARGEQLFVIDAYPAGILFQNETTLRIYTQTAHGIQEELRAATFQMAGSRAHRALNSAVHVGEATIACLVAWYPPLRIPYLVITILRKAAELTLVSLEANNAYQSVRVTLLWLEATWPGFGRAIIRSALHHARRPLELVNAHFEPNFESWLTGGIRIARTIYDFSGATSTIGIAFDVLFAALTTALHAIENIDLSISVEAVRERTREELNTALQRANIEDAARWAETIASAPRGTIDRLVREIQLLVPAYRDLSRIVARLSE